MKKMKSKNWGWLLAGLLLGCPVSRAQEAAGSQAAVLSADTADYVEEVFGMSIDMVYVAGGTFEMGATPEQGSDAYADETPVHTVTLDAYYIGRYEITQAQWVVVMGRDVIQQRDARDTSYTLHGVGAQYPAYYISWDEAQRFCEKLSAMTGKKYRLPTEAEWEYAARGGRHKDGTKYSGSNEISEVAWVARNSDGVTHPVGQKKPNGLGLYDMSGNVWEWCQDKYCADYYSDSPSQNPQGPEDGSFRVKRGGSWRYLANSGRVSRRYSNFPDTKRDVVGLRVVREL